MRTVPVLALVALCLPQDVAPAPGPAATCVDRAGIRTDVRDFAFAVEETEGGTLFVTRLPYLPLRRGAGEWRLPLADVHVIEVVPPDVAPALTDPAEWRGRFEVGVAADGAISDVRVVASTGVAALDAGLAAAVRSLALAPGRTAGPSPLPARLDATVRVGPAAPPSGEPPLRLRVRVADGRTVEGEVAITGVCVGTFGSGEFRLPLAACARVEFGARPDGGAK